MYGTRTYYPGVIGVDQAQPITVAAGEDRTPTDVVVAATPPRIIAPPPWGTETEPDVAYGRGIRGRITRADGRPLPQALVRLASSESHLGFPPIMATDNDGRYEFRRLPSGPYTVVASRPGFLTRERSTPRLRRESRSICDRASGWSASTSRCLRQAPLPADWRMTAAIPSRAPACG